MITKHQIYIKSMGVYIDKVAFCTSFVPHPFLSFGITEPRKNPPFTWGGVSVLYKPSPIILDIKA